MKKLVLSTLLVLIFSTSLHADAATTAPPKNLQTSPVYNTVKTPAPIYTSFAQCIKTYQLPIETLLYTCLSAITDNNYQIDEVQFKTGTIIFTAYSKEFILVTAKKDMKNSFVKILPVDNNYNFSAATINKIFSYIDMNSGTGVQNLI